MQINYLYECTSEGYDCLQKRFDGVLFSSSLTQYCFVHGGYGKQLYSAFL